MKYIANYSLLNFSCLLIVNFTLIGLINHYVLTIEFYRNSNETLSGIPGQDILVYAALQKWIYLTSFIYLLIKLSTVSLLLYTALFLTDREVSFKKVFNITLTAEYIFFVPAVIKFLWFQNQYPHGTLTDWHHVYVFSALSLFDTVPADWSYALQTLNLFEVIYWFLLAYGIHKLTKLNFDGSLRIVTISYLPALLIWIATVTFCSLMIYPGTA